jgi:hypothetical protein
MISLQAIYHELRTLPRVSPQEEEASSRRVFERLIDILESTDLLPHEEPVHALITLFSQMMKQHVISITLKPEIPTVTFAVGLLPPQSSLMPVIVFPSNYLEQIRENPLQALGGVVFIASQVRDFVYHQLEPQRSLKRAHAFEVEFLRVMCLHHEHEGLLWEPNDYQRSILEEYPDGLASLASDLVYPTPALTILIQVQEEGNDE